MFTLDNYNRLLTADFGGATINSLAFAGLGGLAATLFYMFLAYLIKRSKTSVGKSMDYVVMIPTVELSQRGLRRL